MVKRRRRYLDGWLLSSLLFWALAPMACRADEKGKVAFDFTAEKRCPGLTQVTPGTPYDAKRGFGFLESGTATDAKVFAVDLDEGNYEVTVRMGDATRATSTTIKAEARRLMLLKAETKAGAVIRVN